MKKKIFRRIAALCLCALMLPSVLAFADEGETEYVVVDPAELESRIQAYIESNNIDPDRISVGFCYTATGDTWIYNPDRWYYAASLYKVPMMMTLAEKVAAGELTQDYKIVDMTLADIEENVLVYSNNMWAHVIREQYYHSDKEWRELVKKYSDMAESDYSSDFVDFFYVNTRYMMDVFKNLYYHPEQFPNITDCLLKAQPGEYLKKYLDGTYQIAQKYGSFEVNGEWFMNSAGIIHTPNPIVVTVLTNTINSQETVIGDMAKLLSEYALELDGKLEEALEKKALEEQQAAEEAARQAQEAEAERIRIEEEQRKALEAQRAAEEAEAARIKAKEQQKRTIKIAAIAAALLIATAASWVVISKKKKARRAAYLKKKRYEKYERRYQAELAAERERQYAAEGRTPYPRQSAYPERERSPRRDQYR